jgi:hypothetical protein
MKPFLSAVLAFGMLSLTGCRVMAQAQSVCPTPSMRFEVPLVDARVGCPLSAVIETEHTRILVDGTKNQKKKKEIVYRDSAGRIRYEFHMLTDIEKAAPYSPQRIEIYDPVAGFWYLLIPQSRVASRHRLNEPATSGKNSQPEHVPALVAFSPSLQEPQPKSDSDEELAPQTMEGIRVTGRRSTTTLEGADGRSYTRISEVWSSSAMGLVLLEKFMIPRSGNLIERIMTNLNQSEPDPSLFRVPTDYTLKD